MIHEFVKIWCRVDGFTWYAVPVLGVLILHLNWLSGLASELSADLLLGMLAVALHEVGKASSRSCIQHLLAILRISTHHLRMFLLFKFVVESLVVLWLIWVTMASVGSEHIVNVLSKRYLRAKSVHKISWCVIICVASAKALQTNVAVTIVSLRLSARELIKVRRVLLIMLPTPCVSHRISLQFVESPRNALDLRGQFQASSNHNLIWIPLRCWRVRISIDSNVILDTYTESLWWLLAKCLLVTHGRGSNWKVVNGAKSSVTH